MKKIIIYLLFLAPFVFVLSSCVSGDYTTSTTIIDSYNITWKDYDGTILGQTQVEKGVVPEYSLPIDTQAWDYIRWTPTITAAINDVTYTAKREVKESQFVGNVFQIMVFDLGEQLISTGSGFVFNEEGWFITNSHVMDDGYFATAIFDIPDSSAGESFTTLDIEQAYYSHSDKDVFIGKISDYTKISENYYYDFDFTTEYEYSDKTYSVGYPNSSINLQINEGEVVTDLSSIYDKVYSGVTYIGSTSYIAPGSSGGILMNENLEVIGMTTIAIKDDSGKFELGGSIEVFNFLNQINSINEYGLKDYAEFIHPTEKVFIGYFKEALDDSKTGESSCEVIDDFTRCVYTWSEEGVNDDGVDYTYTETLTIDSDMWMIWEEEFYWQGGARRESSFYGYYSTTEKLDNFTYEFKATWDSGAYYTLKSTDINYSDNISLTLNKYTTTSSYNYTINEGNIEYSKDVFNYVYSWLSEDMDRFE